MDTLKIAFLWHMHQPCYKDPITNKYILPWVRLHCIREYYDMVCILEQFPEIKQTFNLVPSLVEQIIDYSKDDLADLFLDYTLKPAFELSLDDRKFISKNFFMANWNTMIKPYPGYWNLLKKRGMKKMSDKECLYSSITFTTQDYLDIQVWFNLAWFGYSALKERPELTELISKDKGFTEDDKRCVIEAQFDIIKKIIPTYKKALHSGQIELTTSPFYHPILPLLYDTEFAKRNMPHANLPERHEYPEDAQAHIEKGIELHKQVFGKMPTGLWPPEGSVAPELIPILRKCGIEWIAADEEILFNSVPHDIKGNLLYKPYSAKYRDEKINIVFRDKGLSDFIGFTYFNNPHEQAAEDFCRHMMSIKKHALSMGKQPVVFIILDGENPWENYRNGGEKFLNTLYEKISKEPAFEAVKIGEYLKEQPPDSEIDNLYTGSWINHNFSIWIGHEEDNKAWDYIKKTRSFLQGYLKDHISVPEGVARSAWNEVYISEGSDWFWWYGDDFSTDSEQEFDRLFRSHLAKVYMILNVDVPGDLMIPIKKAQEDHKLINPSAFVSPVIDGVETDYFEWLGAGRFFSEEYGQAMFSGRRYFSGIHYGFDAETLFIRIDPVKKKGETFLSQEFEIHLHILHSMEYKIIFSCMPGPPPDIKYELYSSSDGIKYERVKDLYTIGIKDIVELSIPFGEMNIKGNDKVKLAVELMKGNLVIDRYPRHRFISFTAPGKDFEELMWSVI